jgi:hypothetical protein
VQRPRSPGGAEKRREPRQPWSSAIVLARASSRPNGGRKPWAAALDISPGGISLFTNQWVLPGASYELRRSAPSLVPPREARAVWCLRVGEGLYRAGFAFRTDN